MVAASPYCHLEPVFVLILLGVLLLCCWEGGAGVWALGTTRFGLPAEGCWGWPWFSEPPRVGLAGSSDKHVPCPARMAEGHQTAAACCSPSPALSFILGLRPPRAEALKALVAQQRVRDASALLLPSSPGVQMLMDWTGGALSWPMCRGIWLE